MFGNFIVEDGVELEIPVPLTDVLDFIDRDMPHFKCGEYGYNVTSGKGVLNAEWKVLVKPRILSTAAVVDLPLGYMVMEKVDDNTTSLKIPPVGHDEENFGPIGEDEARLFVSFIFQTLNALKTRGYIELPGVLPVE